MLAVGLSKGKTRAILNLANGSRPTENRQSVAWYAGQGRGCTLTSVAGIGAWTANVFLIFNLGRPDVMPAARPRHPARRAIGLRAKGRRDAKTGAGEGGALATLSKHRFDLSLDCR